MTTPALHLVESAPLPYLLSRPDGGDDDAPRPLLVFLHGYDEGAPTPLREGLTRHGPLAASAAPDAARFVVAAPRMPRAGDLWHRHADAVREIVREVQALHGADPARTCLTGFSFGGNGVFDLALALDDVWAALWAVDPTRVPRADPGRPVWMSSGQVSRRASAAFIDRLSLRPPGDGEPGGRVYLDQGEDHVGTARRAYADPRIYRWLASHALAG